MPVPDEISDGFHTFNELYQHRAALFIAFMQCNPEISWVADKHDDGSMFDGFFIAGMSLPQGQITYHMQRDPWFDVLYCGKAKIVYTTHAPTWDGHVPHDVITRLVAWVMNTDLPEVDEQ
jgi:hypothetical protein